MRHLGMQILILIQIQTTKIQNNPTSPSSCGAGIRSMQEERACLGRKAGEGCEGAGGQMKEPLGAEHVHLAAPGSLTLEFLLPDVLRMSEEAR